jgi:cbb3-type cytochrome oxidase subunit 3
MARCSDSLHLLPSLLLNFLATVIFLYRTCKLQPHKVAVFQMETEVELWRFHEKCNFMFLEKKIVASGLLKLSTKFFTYAPSNKKRFDRQF